MKQRYQLQREGMSLTNHQIQINRNRHCPKERRHRRPGRYETLDYTRGRVAAFFDAQEVAGRREEVGDGEEDEEATKGGSNVFPEDVGEDDDEAA